MSKTEERRDFHRVILDSLCTYSSNSNEHPVQATLKDLSSSGMMLWVAGEFALGDTLKVTITPLNPITQGLCAEVKVARCKLLDIDLPYPRYALACSILSMT